VLSFFPFFLLKKSFSGQAAKKKRVTKQLFILKTKAYETEHKSTGSRETAGQRLKDQRKQTILI